MRFDQYYLIPDRRRCIVYDIVSLDSLLVDKVEDDGVGSRRGYVSSKLLRVILTADRHVQICYRSRCICFSDHGDTKLMISHEDIYRLWYL